MAFTLTPITLPPLDAAAGERPTVPAAEYEARLHALYTAAASDWVLVYGDREHAGNLVFLCGFDPRFEEAVLLLGPHDRRVLLAGNEGMGYLLALTVPVEAVLCQSFSLMGQPRDTAPRLADVLRGIGLGAGQSVGVVGWKYLEPYEDDDAALPAFVPALIVQVLRRLVGPQGVVRDVTAMLSHPLNGLAVRNSAAQIAAYAWGAERASAAVWWVVRGARPGMSEHEAAALMGYQGDPLACHTMMVSDSGPVVGLRSPTTRRMAYGDGVSTAVGLRGGLCCRAGILSATPDASFVERYVLPYFAAQATWWQQVRIGLTGGDLYAAILQVLDGAAFRPALNPGHLTATEEWTHSPVRPHSIEPIVSGMMLQCDIIPTPLPDGAALNCEDTVAVADAALRAELRAGFPDLWARIEARREFMRVALGLTLPEELLPLSVAPACLPPFWLAPNLVCRVAL